MRTKTYTPHKYHLVAASPSPLLVSLALLGVTIGGVMYMHAYTKGGFVLILSLMILCGFMFDWFSQILKEGDEGAHTFVVQQGLRLGFLLFILSEVMFFSAFFWAYFHSSMGPTISIYGEWTPQAIECLNPLEVPLINTIVLLTSGATVTQAHFTLNSALKTLDAMQLSRTSPRLEILPRLAKWFSWGTEEEAVFQEKLKTILVSLSWTIALAIVFTLLQLYEYNVASFSINDGIYGSTFYLTTGFHGLHVIIGTIFLVYCTIRYYKTLVQPRNEKDIPRIARVGFECATWYWHFVDIVWLFLFFTIYVPF